jgi:hypothetical protein
MSLRHGAERVSPDAADRWPSPCSGGAVPAQDSLNPRRQLRLDPRVAVRRLRRVALLAPSLAFLLLLAAAGAVSAADPLDLGDATAAAPVIPAVDPVSIVENVVAKAEPAKDGPIDDVVGAVPPEPVDTAAAIVRGARDKVEAIVRPIVRPVPPIEVPPVTVPPVTLPDRPDLGGIPDVVDGPARVVHPRRPLARAAALAPTQATPAVEPAIPMRFATTPDWSPASVATHDHSVDGLLVLRPSQAVLPFGPSGTTGDGAFGASGAGSGPWLGQGSVSLLGFPWRSVARPAAPLSVPRGLAPQFVVPPG